MCLFSRASTFVLAVALAVLSAVAPALLKAQEPNRAIEADAQEYARLALRHDSLLIKLNANRITVEEMAEIDQLKARGEAIKARYAPGRASPQDAAAYAKRYKELAASIVVPGVKKAAAEFVANAKKDYTGRISDAWRQVWIAVALVAVAIALVPFGYVVAALAFTRRSRPSSKSRHPFSLPGSLERPYVLGKSWNVYHLCGRVTNRRTWEETYTETTQIAGKRYGADGLEQAPWQAPGEAARTDPTKSVTHGTTTKFFEYAIETPDDHTETLAVRGYPDYVQVGDLLSVIRSNDQMMCCYDHTLDRFTPRDLPASRSQRALWMFIWVVCALVAIQGSSWIGNTYLTTELTGADRWAALKVNWVILGLALLAIPYVSAFQKALRRYRYRQMSRWEAKWLAFMKGVTPQLKTRFTAAETETTSRLPSRRSISSQKVAPVVRERSETP